MKTTNGLGVGFGSEQYSLHAQAHKDNKTSLRTDRMANHSYNIKASSLLPKSLPLMLEALWEYLDTSDKCLGEMVIF